MSTGGGSKKGLLAFGVGVVAAPLAGAAIVILGVGLGMIWWASATGDDGLRPTDDNVAFRQPGEFEANERPARRRNARVPAARNDKPDAREANSGSAASSRDSEPRSRGRQPSPSPSGSTKARGGTNSSATAATSDNEPSGGSMRPGAAGAPAPPEPVPFASTKPAEGSAPALPNQVAGAPTDGLPDVARPIATRTAAAKEPGPHDYPDDGEPSWIPDTIRSVVEQGISMLTGEAPESDVASATPEKTPAQNAPTAGNTPEENPPASTNPEPSATEPVAPRTRTASATPPSDGVAQVELPSPPPDDEPFATDAAPPPNNVPAIPDDVAPVPTSALPTAQAGEDVAFTPVKKGKREKYARGGETLDDIVAGGIGMMTGKGAVEDVAPTYTTRTATDMEESVEDYTDPIAGEDELLEFNEDNYEVNVEEHDAASAFATAGDDAWSDEVVTLDNIIIPVSIRTATPGVPVTVNGEPAGLTPTTIDLRDATHTVVVGVDAAASSFDIQPMANPDAWCFAEKSSGGFRQVPCD